MIKSLPKGFQDYLLSHQEELQQLIFTLCTLPSPSNDELEWSVVQRYWIALIRKCSKIKFAPPMPKNSSMKHLKLILTMPSHRVCRADWIAERSSQLGS